MKEVKRKEVRFPADQFISYQYKVGGAPVAPSVRELILYRYFVRLCWGMKRDGVRLTIVGR